MRISQLIFIIALSIGPFVSNAIAQSENKLASVALVKKDSVILRWVPASIPVWQIGVKYGYVVKRYTIAKGGVFIPDGLSKGELLTPAPILPVSNDAFNIIALSEPRVTVVQDVIYGTDFQLPSEGEDFKGFMKAYDDLEVRFGFALFMCDLSPVIARAAGLQFTDKNILPDERYAYSVSLANIPDGIQVEPIVIVLDAGLETILPKIVQVQAIFLDKAVKLQWPVMLYEGTYTAYNIEKSINGLNFTPVSDLPLVNISEEESLDYYVYTDSLENNNEQTWYRVKGISPFGEEGPASEIVEGKGAPEFTAYAVIDSAVVIDNNKVTISWRVTETGSSPVTGINVLRSDRYDGVFENLTSKPVSPDFRSFTDSQPGISNYYKIMLVGNDNLRSYSFPYLVQTEDNDPPAPPMLLTGKIDSSGLVTIVWKQNLEPDLLGYKVFRANAVHEDYIPISSDLTIENLYFDIININTLTKKIFYQVVAVDKHYNSSEYSLTLELSRPDTIPPAPALIKRIDDLNGKVTIGLEGSPSNDISYYELCRVSETKKDSINLKTWLKEPDLLFEDSPEVSGKYLYLLKTFDSAGNVSLSSRFIFVSTPAQKNISIKSVQSTNGKTIILSWEIPEGFVPEKTLIYRSKDAGALSVCQILTGTFLTYEDNEIEIGSNYSYRIRVFDSLSNAIINSELAEVVPFLNSTSK